LAVAPWAETSEAKITEFTGRVWTPHPIAIGFLDDFLVALGTQFLVLFHIILREGDLKIHFFLSSKYSYLLAHAIFPLKIALSGIG
jgi:hypothetical protein